MAELISQRTGVKFNVVNEESATMWGDNTGVIARHNGGIAVVFDPAHQTFSVGVISGDVWIATGHDLETMMAEDPDLIEILADRKCPFSTWKEAPKATPKQKKTRFTISLLGVEVVVRW